jgi:hypothetical protein
MYNRRVVAALKVNVPLLADAVLPRISEALGTCDTKGEPMREIAHTFNVSHRGAATVAVADEPEGKADQDRREDREPRPLCRVSDGRSRDSQKCVRRYLAAHRGTAAAERSGARVVILHGQLTEGLCPNDGEISRRTFGRRSDANNAPKIRR